MKHLDEKSILEFLDKYGIEHDEPERITDGGQQIKLAHCVFDANHAHGDAKLLISADGKIVSYKCHHNSCKKYGIKDFVKKYDPDFYKDSKFPQKPLVTTTADGGIVTKEQHVPVVVSAGELLSMDLPPVKWLVERILPTGIAILAAPPKYYKSFLALDLCIQICQGNEFFGHKTEKIACLYMDLESGKRRPRDRLKLLLAGKPVPDNLYFVTAEDKPGRIHEGFEGYLQEIIQMHPEIKFIVVDVLQKVKPISKGKQNAYEADYEVFSVLQECAMQLDVSMLIITHTKKANDPYDAYNNINGSNGILGSADTAFMITKQSRFDDGATFSVTGRDVEQMELAITFDKHSMRWTCEGTAEEVERKTDIQRYRESRITKTIHKLLSDNGGTWSGTAEEIITASRVFGHEYEIFDGAKRVGRFLKDNMDNFWFFDLILIEDTRRGNARTKTFTQKEGKPIEWDGEIEK